MAVTRKKRKKKRRKLTAAEKLLRRIRSGHTRMLRKTFRNMGFDEYESLRDRDIKFEKFNSDVDDVFIYENVLLFVERTTAESPSSHFKGKLPLYQKIKENQAEFLEYIRSWPELQGSDFVKKYNSKENIVKVIYASHYDLADRQKDKIESVYYHDYGILRYFYALSEAIKESSRAELLEFLSIDLEDVGSGGVIQSSSGSKVFDCVAMNNSKANLPEGFQVATLYMDAETLIKSSYVLRRQGWKNDINAYQRMLVSKKIKDIREYIAKDGKVFMNNVIVTLPSSSKLQSDIGKSGVGVSTISLPDELNTIGIVDGQHRILSFYEGEPYREEIADRRKRQNLLATAIIYPKNFSERQRQEFEAALFLEINSTQSVPPPALRLSIETLTKPFSDYAIANSVIHKLDKRGALQSQIEKYFFETDKLKPSSIVKFQLNHLVRIPSGDLKKSEGRPRNLFDHWNGHGKAGLISGTDYPALERYTVFCEEKVNDFLLAFKKRLPGDKWTASRKIDGRVLTTLNINAILSCMRELAQEDELYTHEEYYDELEGFTFDDYPNFKSSQYNAMGKGIYSDYFS